MHLIRLGIAPAALVGLAAATVALAQDPPPAPAPVLIAPPPPVPAVPQAPPPPAPAVAQAPPAPPAPPAPYRRCASGRGPASIGTCALHVVPDQTARLQIRLERNLPGRIGAIVLIWRERADVGGVIYRITGRALGANPGQAAGTILSVPVSSSYCAPNNRSFEVELELEDGRNLGLIGRFTFPCSG
ncbi:MAG TPA: hypothetical protein VLK25_07680 [Allosphingosinicella sp.]|nr:hypothetical protein [Allosphingosinicella sp.]